MMEEKSPLKHKVVGNREFKELDRRSGESDNIEVEVVDEIPSPNFNPPLNSPNNPILIQIRELFSEPFSLFSDPHIMLGKSVFSVWLRLQAHLRIL